MAAPENRELVERYFKVVWIDGEWDRAGEFIAEGFTNHGSLPGMPSSGVEDARRIDEDMRRAFPDLSLRIVHIAADEDWVARHWAGDGTHRAEAFGVPATGRRVHMEGMVFSRIVDGKIAEEWRIVDNAGLMSQLSP